MTPDRYREPRYYLADLDGGFTLAEWVGAIVGGTLALIVGTGFVWLVFVALAALGWAE